MVHLLFEHFGMDGQVEAEALLERNCGSESSPRILDAFNSQIEDWLSYFIWCFLADRDGKYQLSCMKHAAFDPLARSSGFILMEEPLHLFIGTHGLERVIARAIELIQRHDTFDIFSYGGIPLATIQRYLNLWAPLVYDLFGYDESKRAREAFQQGLRARPFEPECADHDGLGMRVQIDRRIGTGIETVEVTELEALNASMRQRFMHEASFAIRRWNTAIAAAGIDFELRLPSDRFNRRIGPCAGLSFTPAGAPAPDSTADRWLPSIGERAMVAELMHPVLEPDSYASWIAPPRLGINGQATTGFRYVHF
jgi:benzoyl-CoA 2,3-dioxygenase component B